MPYNVGEIIAAVTRFFQENLPLHTNQEIDIDAHILVRGERRRFHLFVPSLRRGKGAAAPTLVEELPHDNDRNERRGPMLHRCKKEILATLREVKKPLSKTRLFEEMARLGYEWGDTTIMKHVGDMMEDGTIENPEDAKPRGYRLAEE